MRKGELVRTVDDWTVFEGIGYRASDQDRVTEHLVNAEDQWGRGVEISPGGTTGRKRAVWEGR